MLLPRTTACSQTPFPVHHSSLSCKSLQGLCSGWPRSLLRFFGTSPVGWYWGIRFSFRWICRSSRSHAQCGPTLHTGCFRSRAVPRPKTGSSPKGQWDCTMLIAFSFQFSNCLFCGHCSVLTSIVVVVTAILLIKGLLGLFCSLINFSLDSQGVESKCEGYPHAFVLAEFPVFNCLLSNLIKCDLILHLNSVPTLLLLQMHHFPSCLYSCSGGS